MTYAYRNSGAWGAGNGAGAGGRLTSTQADNNIYQLVTAIADIVAAGTAIGIDPDNPVTISGDQLTFHFSDSSEQIITIPTAMPVWRGDFAEVSYAEGDWFASSGAIYRVNVAHTGELPFDPGASNTSSGDLYTKILDSIGQTQTATLSAATYTVIASDNMKYYRCTASDTGGGTVITVPPDLPVDIEISFRQCGNNLSFAADVGLTLNIPAGHIAETDHEGAVVTVKIIASDEADIFGALVTTTA